MKRGMQAAMIGSGLTLGTLAAINGYLTTQRKELVSRLSGESRFYPWKLGTIFYKIKGDGTPLLLVHSINAGASSDEFRKNVDALAEHYKVYALDLLGYGLSERPALDYVPDIYIDLIGDFVREVIGAPCSVIALSLSSAYVIQSAYSTPDLYEKLIFVAPTGITKLADGPSQLGVIFRQVLKTPVIGLSLFNAIVSEVGIRSFLSNQAYYDTSKVTDDLVMYDYLTSHQENAAYAPQAFLSGYLNFNITNQFAQLRQPVLLVWGREDRINPVSNATPFLERNPHAELRIFDHTKIVPNDEQPGEFNALALEWLMQH